MSIMSTLIYFINLVPPVVQLELGYIIYNSVTTWWGAECWDAPEE